MSARATAEVTGSSLANESERPWGGASALGSRLSAVTKALGSDVWSEVLLVAASEIGMGELSEIGKGEPLGPPKEAKCSIHSRSRKLR